MAPILPTPRNQREQRGPMIPQFEQLQQQLTRLGPYKVYTDGGWEYGGVGWTLRFIRRRTPQAIKEGEA